MYSMFGSGLFNNMGNNMQVSRRHAVITVMPDARVCFVKDLSSANGTVLCVGAGRVKVPLIGDGMYQMAAGDKLRLANVWAEITWIESQGMG